MCWSFLLFCVCKKPAAGPAHHSHRHVILVSVVVLPPPHLYLDEGGHRTKPSPLVSCPMLTHPRNISLPPLAQTNMQADRWMAVILTKNYGVVNQFRWNQFQIYTWTHRQVNPWSYDIYMPHYLCFCRILAAYEGGVCCKTVRLCVVLSNRPDHPPPAPVAPHHPLHLAVEEAVGEADHEALRRHDDGLHRVRDCD